MIPPIASRHVESSDERIWRLVLGFLTLFAMLVLLAYLKNPHRYDVDVVVPTLKDAGAALFVLYFSEKVAAFKAAIS